MKSSIPFRPRLLDSLKGYSYQAFHADLLAGITVGIIALSLSMALGIASQRTPGVGIYTAIIAGFLVSVLGGSRVQIGGPTAAFIPVVVGVMVDYGADNLIICTALAGLMLMAMGVARMGTMIKYIPVPVIMGFTAGIAVYILSTQVRDFLGLTVQQAVPAEFIPKVRFMFENIGSLHWPAIGVSVASLALIRYWPGKWGRWIPGSIIAVVVGTVAAVALKIPVETIGSRFGANAIPQGFPLPHWPRFDWGQVQHLFRPAFTIALLAAIESLL